MNTLKSNVYEMGPDTKWESFEDVLIRHAYEKLGITISKEDASKYQSIGEFDLDVVLASHPENDKLIYVSLRKLHNLCLVPKETISNYAKELKLNEKK